mmetsp:Transcript_23310/g.68039  ORF Transcript_23310/g.68039 Transcript_23310/m.68039 type:complete len:203 (+) Transcript_23310:222-830(+)
MRRLQGAEKCHQLSRFPWQQLFLEATRTSARHRGRIAFSGALERARKPAVGTAPSVRWSPATTNPSLPGSGSTFHASQSCLPQYHWLHWTRTTGTFARVAACARWNRISPSPYLPWPRRLSSRQMRTGSRHVRRSTASVRSQTGTRTSRGQLPSSLPGACSATRPSCCPPWTWAAPPWPWGRQWRQYCCSAWTLPTSYWTKP